MKNMDEQRDDFAKWLDQWDKAAAEFAKESAEEIGKPRENPIQSFQNSFFSDSPVDAGEDNQDMDSSDNWRDIYARSTELDYSKEDLLTEIEQDSTGEPGEVKFGGRPPTKSNPIDYSSVGKDQEGKAGRTRVSKNFSDGNELRELDDIKRRLEEMERKFHETDYLSKKTESLQKELDSLRERANKLSQEINSGPYNDVT